MATAHCCNEPKVGDLIEIQRTGYSHWALYVGDGYVIHLAPPSEFCNAGFSSIMSVVADKAYVKMEPLWQVAGTDDYKVNNKLDGTHRPQPIHVIMKEARKQLGKEVPYSVVSSNCEHFVMNLRYGVRRSVQVEDAKTIFGVALMSIAVVGLVCLNFVKAQHRQKK